MSLSVTTPSKMCIRDSDYIVPAQLYKRKVTANGKLLGYVLINQTLTLSEIYKENVNNEFRKRQHIYFDLLGEPIIYYDFNKNQMCIRDSSCLSLAYMYDADYNILFLEDYYEIDQEYLVFDMIDNMILCRKQIIIYDYYDRLGQDNDSLFMRKLRSVIDNKFTFKKEFSSPLVQQIAAKLEKQKYIVYSSNDLTLFVRDKNKLFGVLLFWDCLLYTSSFGNIRKSPRDWILFAGKKTGK